MAHVTGLCFLLSSKTTFLSLMRLLRYQHDLGHERFFLLLNDSSHDSHFSTRQNMEPEEFLEKKSNFSLRRFFRYLTPNMALQKIILTLFFKLKNYVFELNAFTSVPARFGSRKIFLLLNDSSHDSHFSTRQNIGREEFLERKIKFFSPRVF